MNGMTVKLKISVSLGADVVGAVDRVARKEGETRSAVMERWLRQVAHRAKLTRLEEETAAYYDALTPAERADDAAWIAAAKTSTRRLRIDEANTTPVKRSLTRPRRKDRRA